MTCSSCGAGIIETIPNPLCRRLVYVRLSQIRVRLVEETLVLSGRCKQCGTVQQIRDPEQAMVEVSVVKQVAIRVPLTVPQKMR